MALRRGRTYASCVTEEQTVEGGLAEPEELEPDQGSLDLAAPEDRRDRASGVGGRGRRGAAQGPSADDDDPDELVWDRLTRTTLDGIGITPLGTPELLDGLRTAAGRRRPGEWDIRAHLAVVGRQDGQRALLADLEGGVTSLWLEVDEHVDWSACSTRCCSTSRPWSCRRRAAGARAFLQCADGRELHPRTNLGLDARLVSRELAEQAWQRGRARLRRRRDRGPRPGCVGRPGARPLAGRRCALPAQPDRRRVRARRGREASSSSATPRPTSSSRRSPSCAPPVGSGRRVLELSGTERPRPAPARGHQPADDEQVRPVGQHAPHHGGRLRRRRRRCRRRHGAALRQPARHRPTRSGGGSPATPPTCSSTSRTSPQWPTRPAAPTPSRS